MSRDPVIPLLLTHIIISNRIINRILKTTIITLFAIAMGLLEAAVVIYLREILYPEGFAFPLRPIPPDILLTEILREAATIIMLVSIGYLLGKTLAEKFAWFIYCFAVWDIFYYVFLKALIGWPESLMTWDILFLIPVQWTGPVLAPLIISLSMIALACVIIWYSKDRLIRISLRKWAGLITGAIILFLSFIWDYSSFMLRHFRLSEILFSQDKDSIVSMSLTFIPEHFPWFIFLSGQILIIMVTILIWRRIYRSG